MREVGEHRQDRAFPRFAQALARIVGAAAHAFGEVVGVEALQVTEPVAETEEELREDRAGVAARAVERRIGHARERLAGVRVRPLAQRREHRMRP